MRSQLVALKSHPARQHLAAHGELLESDATDQDEFNREVLTLLTRLQPLLDAVTKDAREGAYEPEPSRSAHILDTRCCA
jgi:hypothetical protein